MEKNLSLSDSSLQPSPKHRFGFWVLWLGYLYLCVSGWMRMVTSIIDWYWLNQAGVTPGPLYLAITGAGWGLVGLAALLWLLFGWPWSRLAGTAAALVFALTYWMDRLWVAEGPQNLVFTAGFTLILLCFVVGELKPMPELRALFKK